MASRLNRQKSEQTTSSSRMRCYTKSEEADRGVEEEDEEDDEDEVETFVKPRPRTTSPSYTAGSSLASSSSATSHSAEGDAAQVVSSDYRRPRVRHPSTLRPTSLSLSGELCIASASCKPKTTIYTVTSSTAESRQRRLRALFKKRSSSGSSFPATPTSLSLDLDDSPIYPLESRFNESQLDVHRIGARLPVIRVSLHGEDAQTCCSTSTSQNEGAIFGLEAIGSSMREIEAKSR